MGLSCSKTLENFNCNNKIYFQYIPLCSYHTDIKEAEKESINLQKSVSETDARVDLEIQGLTERMEKIKSTTRSGLIQFYTGAFGIFACIFLN